MRIFLKKFYRNLGESRGQFLPVLAVVMVGVMFCTGVDTALMDVEGTGEEYFGEYRLADIQSTIIRAPERVVDWIRSVPGVKTAQGRAVRDARIDIQDRNTVTRLISLPEQRERILNDILLISDSCFSSGAGNQRIVLKKFFKASGLVMRQTIEPIISSNYVELRVVGTAKSPEYTYGLWEAGDLIPDPKKLGLVYTKESYLQIMLDIQGTASGINVLLDQNGDTKTVEGRVKEILRQYGENNTIEKRDRLSCSMLNPDVDELESIGTSFLMLFFIASAVIIYIAMTRVIGNRRALMGISRASGYNDWDIMLRYETYPPMVGLLGSVVGSLMGISMVGNAMTDLYNTYYNLPIGGTVIHWDPVLPASLSALFFCMVADYNMCRRKLRLILAESTRPKAPASGRRVLLENREPLWKSINFSRKIIIRSIFRYKERSVIVSVGIILSTALALMAMGFQNSVDYLVDVQFREIQKFDLKTSLSKILDVNALNDMRSIDHIKSAESVPENGMEIVSGWRGKDIGIVTLDNESQLYGALDTEGRRAVIPKGEISLPKHLMDALGVDAGDRVFLHSSYPGKNEGIDKRPAITRGNTMELLGQSATCNTGYLDYLFHEGTVIGATYVRLEGLEHEKEAIRELKDRTSVNTVQSKVEIVSSAKQIMSTMNSMVLIMILGTGVLTFATIYNIISINIFGRRREIATLSVLGSATDELKDLVLYKNSFFNAFDVLIGLLPEKLLTRAVLNMSATKTVWFPAILNPSDYFITALLVGTSTLTTNLLLGKEVRGTDMVGSLRSTG